MAGNAQSKFIMTESWKTQIRLTRHIYSYTCVLECFLFSQIVCFTEFSSLWQCLLRGTGGHGFDLGPRHTRVVKNGTSCSSLGTQTYGVELGLVNPVSG